jgi:hypothetical protein
MSISLPSSLATAIRAGQDLEARIAKTQAALANARDHAERARIEVKQAELERDRLAAERDMALASIAMGEAPDTDPAALEKGLAAANKRLISERAERGLHARLARERTERTETANQIAAAQVEARQMLQDEADNVFDEVTKTLIAKLDPIVAAEEAVDGYLVRRSLRAVILPSGEGGQPTRQHRIQDAIQKTTAPAAFQEAAGIIRRFARPIQQDEAA